VSLRKSPFVSGEILENFESKEHLYQALLASANVPLMLGILPKRVSHSKGFGYYYDGMFWSQTLGFVPWRGFTPKDEIIRLSTLSKMFPLREIIPTSWSIFPPSESVLRGMHALGYIEAHRLFANREEFLPPEPISEEMLAQVEHFRATARTWWRRLFLLNGSLCAALIAYSIL